MADHNVEEKGVGTPTQHSANGSTEEKPEPAYHHDETGLMESMHAAAERGHLATDKSVVLTHQTRYMLMVVTDMAVQS